MNDSPASVHAATALGLTDHRDRLRRYDNNLENLGMILAQLHLQYDFIHEEQMARGELSRYRALLLPWSSAVSRREATAIRQFVEQGGALIADSFCGVRDDHGKPQAMLDDLFGLRQTLTPPELQPRELTLKPTARPAQVPAAPATLTVASGSPEVQLAGGTALATCGDSPALITHRVGRGRTLFLNCSFSNYAEVAAGGVAGETQEEEQAPESVTAPIRRLLRSLLAASGLTPAVQVHAAADRDVQVQTSRLALDRGQLLGVVRAITRGPIDPADLLPCTLTLARPAHVYEARSGKALGHVARIEDHLPRGVARVYALLPYRVQKVSVETKATARAGQPLPLELTVTAAGTKDLGTHVLHLTLRGPDGKERPWYARNLVARGGRTRVAVPLACNDEPGRWTVLATDMATRTTGKLELTVHAAVQR